MYRILSYDWRIDRDEEVCAAETLEELIELFEPVKKNHPFYWIRKEA